MLRSGRVDAVLLSAGRGQDQRRSETREQSRHVRTFVVDEVGRDRSRSALLDARGASMEAVIGQILNQYERGSISRRQLIQGLSALAVAAVSDASAQSTTRQQFRATGINHLSFQVSDYRRTRDFYASLLGMRVANDDPATKQCQLFAGDSFIFARTARPGQAPPRVDHFAIGIADWDKARVEAELKRRNLQHTADLQLPNDSVHLRDPDGYDLQIMNEKIRS
jgi:catechol 2,3-dioxygenase-like lactoylglutathione lyase family enzyme